ncbi:uncharacterized protein K02A2.6-like [Anopheles merus]|uniref:uncharacterized protein K02A2.6-like n=1 Tax=Anopheles merus TaxID=30066 RepID=UPI001BE4686B|nr:uncharacterized protein K02A2.6-like [Anopheles merus]
MQEMRPVPMLLCDKIETAKLATEWKIWKEALECYFAAYNVTDQTEKKAKLLHLGGPALPRVFKNLKDHDHVSLVMLEPRWYDQAVEKLDEFFGPQYQATTERRNLRMMKQKPGERFAEYLIRLKQQASQCGFDKYSKEVASTLRDIYLTDAVVQGCSSNEVRRKILQKNLKFSEIEDMGVAQESIDNQTAEMAAGPSSEKVFKIEHGGRKGNPRAEYKGSRQVENRRNEKACFNCGRVGHFAASFNCPARGKECRNCKKLGHFEQMCRKFMEKGPTKRQIRAIDESSEAKQPKTEEETHSSKVYYAFYSVNESNVISCMLGGVSLEMMVDSGADANLIPSEMWEELKNRNIAVVSSTKRSSKILRAYGSKKPLTILGTFVAEVAVGGQRIQAEFFVVEKGQRCLLGDKTAKQLGILKVGLDINRVQVDPFPKMKGITAKIKMNPQIIPVYQPMRRIPIPLEESVDRKLDGLLKRDIIEIKTGPTTRVSPLVVVGKSNGEPRLCLEDSRDVTTFITRRGLYRFKRLPFGLVTAPELFQKAMDETLSGCEGTIWYLDDVLIEGQNLQEHDKRLNKVLSRLKNRGIELNWEKCQLRVSDIEFLGHSLNQEGIMPSRNKIGTILSFREPRCETEVRSFLGLANYMNKFVPMLATLDEPLR